MSSFRLRSHTAMMMSLSFTLRRVGHSVVRLQNSHPSAVLWRSLSGHSTSSQPDTDRLRRVNSPSVEKQRSGTSTPKVSSRENIYTLPNGLTLSRILACPLLGWTILDGNFTGASCLLAYAGVTDWVDGFLARRYRMTSVLGTILDPAADKILMTTLTVCLTMKDLLPTSLALIIIGRDVILGISALYIRYKSLPEPKTFLRYWDLSLPSAEVRPTKISKVNTALQLALMGITTVSPLIPLSLYPALSTLQLLVAGTTVASGFSYVFASNAVKIVR